MRKIRIAQIGTSGNSHGNPIWNTMVKRPEVFEIAGYAMPENEKEKFPKHMERFQPFPELTVQQILEDPTIEAVIVETEEIYLTKYALMAARAGKHIHMEKPGGTDLQAFRALIAAMKESGKVFHTGYMYRYNPMVQQALEKVRSGELGDIISVEAQMNCNHPPETRQWLENFPGGMMFFLGCHMVDLVMQVQGVPKRVIPLNRSTGTDAVTAEDFSMAVLEYDRGWSLVKTNACEIGGFRRRQLVITGSKGTLELKPLEIKEGIQYRTPMTEYFDEEWEDAGKSSMSESYHRYAPMLLSFAQMVRGEKENPWSPDYELALFETIFKCCGGNESDA